MGKEQMYGVVLNPDASPQRYMQRKMISDYFANPKLSKINNTNNQSIYAGEGLFQTMGETRYLVVSTNLDHTPIGTIKNLFDIRWDVLQTRKYTGDDKKYNVPQFSYTPPSDFSPQETKILLTCINRSDTITSYTGGGLAVNMLIPSNKGKYQYPEKITLSKALEEYNTVLTFND